MTLSFFHKCRVLLACGTLPFLTSCHPKKLDDIKAAKAETEVLLDRQNKAALELAGLTSQLEVLGKDSKRSEENLEALAKQKALLEKEKDRVTKLTESIAEQTELLKKEHAAYARKFNPK